MNKYDEFSYGKIEDQHVTLFGRTVCDQIVYDIGSGSGGRSLQAMVLGAKQVTAIDKAPLPNKELRALQKRGILFIHSYFDKLELVPEPGSVAMLFYPNNTHSSGLVNLLERFDRVLYFGLNSGGVMCGHNALFHHLMRRELLETVDGHHGAMTLYGAQQERTAHPVARCAEEQRWLDLIAYSSSLFIY